MMAAWMARASDGTVDACDAIIPVPLHAYQLWGRRFNQSAELARAIGPAFGQALSGHRIDPHQANCAAGGAWRHGPAGTMCAGRSP